MLACFCGRTDLGQSVTSLHIRAIRFPYSSTRRLRMPGGRNRVDRVLLAPFAGRNDSAAPLESVWASLRRGLMAANLQSGC